LGGKNVEKGIARYGKCEVNRGKNKEMEINKG
jgi:hypothetical protein